MHQIIRKMAAIAALALPISAMADPIVVVADSPATLGGYTMSAFTPPSATDCAGTGADQWVAGQNQGPLAGVTSTASPIDGKVEFKRKGGGSSLCMSVDHPSNADWWEHDNHGNIFTTTVNWIELIMPANTRAFSLFVGGVSGSGWIEAMDSSGNTAMQTFGGQSRIQFGSGNTPGFGVYSSDKCSSITKIVIEPWEWGTGQFAINQDSCSHNVPEPAPILLLMTGLFGLALSRRFNKAIGTAR